MFREISRARAAARTWAQRMGGLAQAGQALAGLAGGTVNAKKWVGDEASSSAHGAAQSVEDLFKGIF